MILDIRYIQSAIDVPMLRTRKGTFAKIWNPWGNEKNCIKETRIERSKKRKKRTKRELHTINRHKIVWAFGIFTLVSKSNVTISFLSALMDKISAMHRVNIWTAGVKDLSEMNSSKNGHKTSCVDSTIMKIGQKYPEWKQHKM